MTGRLGLLRRELVRESHVLRRDPQLLAQHIRNDLFLEERTPEHGWLVERADAALRDRRWLRLRNRPWVPLSRPAYLYSLPVSSVTWSADGSHLLRGSQLLDPSTGEVVGTLPEPPKPTAGRTAWSPDRAIRAEGRENGDLELRDEASGTIERVATEHDEIWPLAWGPQSAQGRLLASGGTEGRVFVWLVRSPLSAGVGRPDHPAFISPRPITSLAFSPEGLRLACGTWDSETDVELELTHGHVAVLDSFTGSTEILWGHWFRVEAVAWSPDGRFLASGAQDSTARVWRNGECVGVLYGHEGPVLQVGWSPDGTLLATSDGERTIFWQAAAFSQIPREESWQGQPYSHRDGVRAVAWSADGRMFASCGLNAEVFVWDGDDGRLLPSPSGPGVGEMSERTIAWHPARPLLAVAKQQLFGSPTVLVWDVDAASVTASVTLPDEDAGRGRLGWTLDGRLVSMRLDEGGGWLWEPGSSEVRQVSGDELGSVPQIRAPSGLEAAGEGAAVVVRRWGREVARAHCISPVKAACIELDGRVLHVADDGSSSGNRPIPFSFELCDPGVAQ